MLKTILETFCKQINQAKSMKWHFTFMTVLRIPGGYLKWFQDFLRMWNSNHPLLHTLLQQKSGSTHFDQWSEQKKFCSLLFFKVDDCHMEYHYQIYWFVECLCMYTHINSTTLMGVCSKSFAYHDCKIP